MNDIFSGNSVILTSVNDIYHVLNLFKGIRSFDVVYITVNKQTQYIINSENLIILKRLCKENDWTILFVFEGLIDFEIKNKIDVLFHKEFLNRIVPLKQGFLMVYSDKIDKNDTIFKTIKNIYHVDEIINIIYNKIINMLIIDFNDGNDSEKINYLQKNIVYITKNIGVFEQNFRYKNIKKISMKEEVEM